MLFLSLFVFTGTVRDILSKTTNELIVYNTPGISAIGIRTGKILNLYSDTSAVPAEVKRHCSTLGLKIKDSHADKRSPYIIRAGRKTVLISGFLNKKMLENVRPDISILIGFKT